MSNIENNTYQDLGALAATTLATIGIKDFVSTIQSVRKHGYEPIVWSNNHYFFSNTPLLKTRFGAEFPNSAKIFMRSVDFGCSTIGKFVLSGAFIALSAIALQDWLRSKFTEK